MADEPKAKKSKLKLIIIGLIILIVLGGGGVGAWMFLSSPADDGGGGDSGAASTADLANSATLTAVSVPTFLVNLADPLGRRFIKLTLEFEVPNPDVAQSVESMMPRVRDAVNLLLSSKTYTDLASYESKLLLKNEIMERTNQALGGVKVVRVNFLELVMQ